ncbi:hypothetical protein [Kribbella sancticallisti]|uniref:hypothetical protein n=1 Tax=Kribbella sancticallisti TaxID=460087 RepID=UPI0031D348A2
MSGSMIDRPMDFLEHVDHHPLSNRRITTSEGEGEGEGEGGLRMPACGPWP